MNFNIANMVHSLEDWAEINKPKLLAWLGTGLFGATIVSTAKNAVAANEAVLEYRQTKPLADTKRKQKAKEALVAAPHYIPTAFLAAGTLTCFGGCYSELNNRLTEAVGVLALCQDDVKALKKALLSAYNGDEKKAEEETAKVLDKEAEAKVKSLVVPQETYDGSDVFLDSRTGVVFRSCKDCIKDAERMVSDSCIINAPELVSIKEFYSLLHVEGGDALNHIGWDAEHPIRIKIRPIEGPSSDNWFRIDYDYTEHSIKLWP